MDRNLTATSPQPYVSHMLPLKDEKAYLLEELVGPSPRPGGGMRRWQCITVNRNDQKVRYQHDMGPAADFETPQLQVLGLWEMTVGELQDIADDERQRLFWNDFLAHKLGESTLVEDFWKCAERLPKWIRSRSVFGPGINLQRNP